MSDTKKKHPDAPALRIMADRFLKGDMTDHERTIAGVALTIGINAIRRTGIPHGVEPLFDAIDKSLVDLSWWFLPDTTSADTERRA